MCTGVAHLALSEKQEHILRMQPIFANAQPRLAFIFFLRNLFNAVFCMDAHQAQVTSSLKELHPGARSSKMASTLS